MSGEFPAMRFSPAPLLLFWSEFFAKFADNFPINANEGLEFKSILDHTSVSRVSDIAENRSKSARVRAICDRARTRRAPWSA